MTVSRSPQSVPTQKWFCPHFPVRWKQLEYYEDKTKMLELTFAVCLFQRVHDIDKINKQAERVRKDSYNIRVGQPFYYSKRFTRYTGILTCVTDLPTCALHQQGQHSL